jgi:uncharacterized protein (DUF2141 family)
MGMKKVLRSLVFFPAAPVLVALLAFGVASGAGKSYADTLTVNVENVSPGDGYLMIGVYDDEKNFTKKYLTGQKAEATEAEMTVVFQDLPHGRYAVAGFQDSNVNDRLDTNFFGIPSERYGLSNDAERPDFEKCAFDFESDLTITVKLK